MHKLCNKYTCRIYVLPSNVAKTNCKFLSHKLRASNVFSAVISIVMKMYTPTYVKCVIQIARTKFHHQVSARAKIFPMWVRMRSVDKRERHMEQKRSEYTQFKKEFIVKIKNKTLTCFIPIELLIFHSSSSWPHWSSLFWMKIDLFIFWSI